MPVINTKVDSNSEKFKSNREHMLAAIEAWRAIEQVAQNKEEQARKKFENRGQLLPRERISLLLDRNTPFLELSTLAGYQMHDDQEGESAGGGMITGIGYVSGQRCFIYCNNSAIKGGTIAPTGVKKTLRAQQIAMQNKLPIIQLVESGGANLLHQAEIFMDGGRCFANQARLSAMGIPQITIVHGSSTAGGAYLPGLSDYVIVVKNKAKIFLAGPPLLKAATGEVATDEDLGGADMHAKIAGTADYLANNDVEAIEMARDVFAKISHSLNKKVESNRFKEPVYESDDLLGIVSHDFRMPYDVREVIARIVDASEFLEFKELFDKQTICGHAKIQGHACAIIGNNGPITTNGALKATQFIQLCCQANIPIIYLQNTTGFMVGTEAEQSGIVKHGSKMIQAVANATVPQITLMIGASFGAGNYGMCGRGFDPRFIFAWPNYRSAVMGGEQAAKVMRMITEEKLKRADKPIDETQLQEMEKSIINGIREQSTAFYNSARLQDDGIIDPRESRKVLAQLLAICCEEQKRILNNNTFGVARM